RRLATRLHAIPTARLCVSLWASAPHRLSPAVSFGPFRRGLRRATMSSPSLGQYRTPTWAHRRRRKRKGDDTGATTWRLPTSFRRSELPSPTAGERRNVERG